MESHPYTDRYQTVWQNTLDAGELPVEQIEKSRYYFEPDSTTPKEFDTYGVVALMPMPEHAQATFTDLWTDVMTALDNPAAYAVEPQNRHIELLLFSRPEEVMEQSTIDHNIQASFTAMQSNPPQSFSVTFGRPFITPDGTVVAPGFPHPEAAIDNFRSAMCQATNGNIPTKQSQWLHVSLGRILEPLDADRCREALQALDAHWGEPVIDLEVNELQWTHEKQWYMLKKDVLHRLVLES